MARNRKNQPSGFSFGQLSKVGLICFCIVASCVGYLWQKRQIADLSQQIRAQEKQLVNTRADNIKLRKQLAQLLSPTYLDSRVKDLKLGLGPAQPAQIWRLPEPAGDTAARTREAHYALAAGEDVPAGEQ